MRICILLIMLIISNCAYCQTLHALIFSNMKESAQRSADRTEEMKNMSDFCKKLAASLGYHQDIRTHSDTEFTSSQFLKDLESMSVGPDDVVMFFYNGHGCNWDDDDWPHMCFKDKQYWESTAFESLKEKCGNAKLILCIGCCCNMDSRGRAGYDVDYDYKFDSNKARALFSGFSGKRRIITSSSIRGQYSYSWTSGSRMGSIYGISLREALSEVLSSSATITPTWENTLNLAKSKTMNYTSSHKEGPQTPQYRIEDVSSKLSPRAQRILKTIEPASAVTSKPTEGMITSTSLQKNVSVGGLNSLVISVDFNVQNLSPDGGRIVAFLESPKGIGVKDKNGRFCTSDGKVSVGKDFGTRKHNVTMSDFQLVIPVEELHIEDGSKTYYFRIGMYDYKSKKYISFGEYVPFKL